MFFILYGHRCLTLHCSHSYTHTPASLPCVAHFFCSPIAAFVIPSLDFILDSDSHFESHSQSMCFFVFAVVFYPLRSRIIQYASLLTTYEWSEMNVKESRGWYVINVNLICTFIYGRWWWCDGGFFLRGACVCQCLKSGKYGARKWYEWKKGIVLIHERENALAFRITESWTSEILFSVLVYHP